jgi:hypothetical protein
MERLRTPFLLIAIALFALVVAVELGSSAVTGATIVSEQALLSQLSGEVREEYEDLDDDQRAELRAMREGGASPGIGITYMALVDGILLYTLVLVGIALILPERVQGRIQGLVTLVLSLLLILGSIVLAIVAVVLLLVMIALLLAVPFGTIAYMARFAFFDTGRAAAILGLLMMLKLSGAGLLVAAQQRFLQNRGLVLMVLTSLLANIILAFLHGFPPGFLVSITDAIGAIVFAIVAIIWGLALLIGGVVAVLKAVRVDRGLV